VNAGANIAPTCVQEGFTGEFNNLPLVGTPARVPASTLPAIVFTESNAANSTLASCTCNAPGVPLPRKTRVFTEVPVLLSMVRRQRASDSRAFIVGSTAPSALPQPQRTRIHSRRRRPAACSIWHKNTRRAGWGARQTKSAIQQYTCWLSGTRCVRRR
jgi:hypothetical protein